MKYLSDDVNAPLFWPSVLPPPLNLWLDDVTRLWIIKKCIGDLSRSQNSKFTGIIKFKVTYLVSVCIFLPLKQFQLAPLALAKYLRGASWNCYSDKKIRTETRYVTLNFIIPVNFEFWDLLRSPIHFFIIPAKPRDVIKLGCLCCEYSINCIYFHRGVAKTESQRPRMLRRQRR